MTIFVSLALSSSPHGSQVSAEIPAHSTFYFPALVGYCGIPNVDVFS